MKNEEVFERVGERRSLWKTLVRRSDWLMLNIMMLPSLVNTLGEEMLD